MHAIGVGLTDQGLVRDQNEDAILVDDALGLYVVCDGMGGHAAGDVASKLAIETLRAEIEAQESVLVRGRRGEETEDKLFSVLKGAAHRAGEVVYKEATENEAHAGMGCTLTALLVVGSHAFMAHVGDTRLYLFRDKKLHQLSRDHTYAAELVRAGGLTAEKAKAHRFSHILSRALGTQELVQVDAMAFELLPGDRLLMCSDGLHGVLSTDAEMLDVLNGDFEAIPDALIASVKGRSKDNISAITVRIEMETKEKPIALSLQTNVQIQLSALGGLFKDLTLSQLTFLLQAIELEAFEEGQIVRKEKEPIEALLIIAEGRFEVTRDDEVIAELGAGDSLGMTSLVSPRLARASLMAKSAGQLLRLSKVDFQRVTRARPWLGIQLLEMLSARFAQALDRRVDQAGETSSAHLL